MIHIDRCSAQLSFYQVVDNVSISVTLFPHSSPMTSYYTFNDANYQRVRRKRIAPPMPVNTLLSDAIPTDSDDSLSAIDADSLDYSLDANGDTSRVNLQMSDATESDFIDPDSPPSMDTDTSFESMNDTNLPGAHIDDIRPLFHQSSVSVTEASRAVLTLALKLNLNKSNIKSLLDCFHKLLPIDNKLPRTTIGFFRRARVESLQKASYFCSQCLAELSSSSAKQCSIDCSADNLDRLPMHIVEVHWNDVSKQVKRVADRYLTLIND